MGKYVAIPSSYPLSIFIVKLCYADSCIIGIWLRHLTFLHVKSHSLCTGDLFLFYTKSLATKFIHTRCWEVKTCKFKSLLQHIKYLGIFLSLELKMWKFLNIFKLVHGFHWLGFNWHIYIWEEPYTLHI